MYGRLGPRKGHRDRTKLKSDELGAVLVETVLVFGLMLPIFGGMLMVSQISQERTLVGQVLRAATRPVTFHESIDAMAGEEEDGSQLDEIQEAVCDMVELTLEAARVPLNRFTFTIEQITQSEPQDGVTTHFLEVTATRNTPMNIPFYGTVPGTATQRTVFPVRLAASQGFNSDDSPFECFRD